MKYNLKLELAVKLTFKMIKNNLFNRIFKSSEIAKIKKNLHDAKARASYHDTFIESLSKCRTLEGLMQIHKSAWQYGLQNANLAPCSCGIFRTKSIETMVPQEVFLGGIWGLYTMPLSAWKKDEKYGCNGYGIDPNTNIYDIVFKQYHDLLESNWDAIYSEALEYISDAESFGF